MQITIVSREQAFDSVVAWKIIGEILRHEEGRTTLHLSTGKTAQGVYRAMARIYAAHPFPTGRVCIFGTSEMAGIARSCPDSRYNILEQMVIKPLKIYEENFLMPMPFPDDPERECRAHEAIIEARGGIDLQLLEPEEDGGLDVLCPGTPFGSTAFLQKTDAGQTRMTLGMQNLMHSRKLLLAVRGRGQAELLQRLLCGPVTEDVPASVLRLHPFLEVVADSEAAALVRAC